MNGVNSFMKADLIARQMEKMQLAIFSYVDSANGIGLFIVDDLNKLPQIENMIPSIGGCSFVSSEEVPLSEDSFLEMYKKRGGSKDIGTVSVKPNLVTMGPYVDLTNQLFAKAIDVWDRKYSAAYKNISQGLPEHYPVMIKAGNSEFDASKFEQLKKEWMNNYPEEAQSYNEKLKAKESKTINNQ
jgi:hypothetical protein